MSNNISQINTVVESPIPSTQGMTTRVVKGSLWTLGGQVLPLAVSFFITPFVIRLLGGEEPYGVYILVGLIPSYFAFADLGMSLGSTKFGSEAYARGSREDEGRIVRTAALIAFLASFPIALGIFILSHPVIAWLNVPKQFRSEASIALKIASVTFVVNILCNVFNTPQLSRLRMDLNTFINAGFRLLGAAAVPVVLYFGGGIVGAVTVLMIAGFLTLFGHILVSGRLLNEIFQFSIDRSLLKPLLRFGAPLVVSGIAAILLVNLEKIVLTRAASVEVLAYYSVAFTMASMATMFSSSMIQSLLPAFSQLLGPDKKEELNKLFARSLRINIIGLIPTMMILFVIAKPFFTIWAGENFGRESSLPFYVLLIGLFFNIVAYVPYSVLMASGKTGIFAKIYWIELVPYIFIAALLTYKLGAVGAALAWSLRVFADGMVIIWLSKKFVGVTLNIFSGKGYVLPLIILIVFPPLIIARFVDNYTWWLMPVVPLCTIFYFAAAWMKLLEQDERFWLNSKFAAVFNRQS